MYLLSLYFDEKTNQIIRGHMQCAADASGNTDMLDKQVPPHITLTVFESGESESVLTETLDKAFFGAGPGELVWVSVAAFLPHVLYLAPVHGKYLQQLSETACGALATCSDTRIQECYRPYHWLPHTTVARRLTEKQMQDAFAALQTAFQPFVGEVVRIGLSTGTPKKEIKTWRLKRDKEESV